MEWLVVHYYQIKFKFSFYMIVCCACLFNTTESLKTKPVSVKLQTADCRQRVKCRQRPQTFQLNGVMISIIEK